MFSLSAGNASLSISMILYNVKNGTKIVALCFCRGIKVFFWLSVPFSFSCKTSFMYWSRFREHLILWETGFCFKILSKFYDTCINMYLCRYEISSEGSSQSLVSFSSSHLHGWRFWRIFFFFSFLLLILSYPHWTESNGYLFCTWDSTRIPSCSPSYTLDNVFLQKCEKASTI